MSGRLPTLGLSLLLLFLAACNQAAPPESTTPPEAAAPQLEPAVPQLETHATVNRTFSATGAEQTFVVPAGITSVTVEARGAPGGTSPDSARPSGRGAVVTSELTVTPGQTLYLNVGGAPTGSGCYPDTNCVGGFNGGGSGAYFGAGGGGASDVRTVSRSETGSLESRLLVAAGGGGGGGYFDCASGGEGGDAGSAGENGAVCVGTPGTGGGAGTQSAGGAGGSPGGASGSLGQGGNGGRTGGGGGGGGLYGGGGGGTWTGDALAQKGGGGGGSSLDPDGGNITLDDSRTPQITISYTKQDQTLSFTSTAPTDAKVGGSYTPTATAISGLGVTFGTTTPSTCTIADDTVSFIAVGECIVTADQAGDEGYNAAPQVTQTFTIKQSQTVSFTRTAPTGAKVGGSYSPTATATSGLDVTFGTSTPTTCTFAEGTVSFVAAGDCTVTADQPGDATYNAAPQVTQTFTIAPKQDQTISFTSSAPTNATVGGSYTPTATATSGLTVTFGTSTPSVCTFVSGSVSFVGTGTCTVTADQAGDATYNPAAQATQSFTVSLPPAVANTYTIDLTTAPLNRILYSVKVGQGVAYSGTGTAISDPIRVDGYRYQNGNKLGGNQVKAITVNSDKVLTVVKAGTNTPNPTGGELDIKPAQSFGGPSAGKNGLVTLKSITVDGVSTNNAKLILYGNGVPVKTFSLAKTPTQTLILNEPNVGFIQVRANDSFTVDDVVFEVPAKQ